MHPDTPDPWTPPADAESQPRQVRRILRLFRPYRGRLGVVGVLVGASSLVSVATPFLLKETLDVAIPEDDQISRFQAILIWDADRQRLTVQTRPPAPPAYPTPPANQTLVFDEKVKKLIEAPGGKCVVGRGESFWIGQTRFTLHSDGEQEPESPADATVAPRQEERTRALAIAL